MLAALRALADDDETRVIVLISKPPSPTVASRILALAAASGKPTVVHFLGAEPGTVQGAGVHAAQSLAEAADIAVALAQGSERTASATVPPNDSRLGDEHALDGLANTQRTVRGLFTGGTFCYEAQLAFLRRGLPCRSNAPVQGALPLDAGRPDDHVFIDMGDDEYTRGRPHPMIDPSLRNVAIREAGDDPAVADPAVRRRPRLRVASESGRRPRRRAAGRAARGSAARAQARGDRPRLRHRWRSAGPGRAGSHARVRRRAHRRQQHRGGGDRGAVRAASCQAKRRCKRDEDAVQGHAESRQRRPRRLRRQRRGRRRRMRGARVAAAGARRSRRGLGARAVFNDAADRAREPGRLRALSRSQSRADRRRDRARRRFPAMASGRPADPARRTADRVAGDVRTDARRDPRRDRCYEGWADTIAAADATGRTRRSIALEPCHHHGAVGPMAGIISPSMPVWVVENATRRQPRLLQLQRRARQGAALRRERPEVLDRLRWHRERRRPDAARGRRGSSEGSSSSR